VPWHATLRAQGHRTILHVPEKQKGTLRCCRDLVQHGPGDGHLERLNVPLIIEKLTRCLLALLTFEIWISANAFQAIVCFMSFPKKLSFLLQ